MKKAFAPNLGAAGRKTKGKVRTHHLAALLFLHVRECSACWCVLRARRRPTAALRDPGRRDPKVHQWSIMALHLVQQSVIPCVELGPALARVLVMHWRSGMGSEWAKSGNTAMLKTTHKSVKMQLHRAACMHAPARTYTWNLSRHGARMRRGAMRCSLSFHPRIFWLLNAHTSFVQHTLTLDLREQADHPTDAHGARGRGGRGMRHRSFLLRAACDGSLTCPLALQPDPSHSGACMM